MTLTTGAKLGPYEILQPIGAGGQGEVYKARDTRLNRTVAIKVLPAHFSDNTEIERALRACGADVPGNMQWQTVQEAKIKDRTERNCRRE
jgi:serine/threonine protein kinase